MTAQFTLPSKREEAWRYSDLKALEAALALPPAEGGPASETLSLCHSETRHLPSVVTAGAAHPERVIEVEAGCKAVLIETLGGHGWLNANTAVRLGAGAELVHIIQQTRADDAVTTAAYAVEVAAGARYHNRILNIGGTLGRIQLEADIQEGAAVELGAVLLAQGSQTIELVTRFNHRAPDATSRQTVRSVAAGKGTVSYLGKIVVAEGAQRIDAEQSSKALLLQRTATANAKPELEIYANEVKCAHGATVGELDKQALFYLSTRGIDPAEAKALLTEAFVADVLEAIEVEAIREDISALATDRLRAMVRGA